jgi:transposase InsO family protein
VSEKYAFIDAEKAQYPVVKACVWLGVSTSGYYEWVDRPASATAQRRKHLAVLIEAIFDESDGTYGYRRVHAALVRQGDGCCAELVRDIMRELGLVACQPRPWRPTTTQAGEGAEALPDLVARDFGADVPGTKMVGDITYLPTWEGFAYLATVIDCCTKECVGYAIAEHMRAELVIDALRMAARNHNLDPEAIFHTDHGSQYLSRAFAEVVDQLDLRHSVGRVGSCFDNAQAESFNATLKVERVNRTVYPTREHARKDVARYIEFRYNTKRLHSALGYRTPQEARVEYQNQRSAA